MRSHYSTNVVLDISRARQLIDLLVSIDQQISWPKVAMQHTMTMAVLEPVELPSATVDQLQEIESWHARLQPVF